MTLPIPNAQALAATFRTTRINNLIAQSKAQQVLREVQEKIDNFPAFDSDLDNRTTFVAYGLLAAGCSLVELNETLEGQAELLKAADLLESIHRTESSKSQVSSTHCLVGAMAFYACGQYSRAFVLIRQIEACSATTRFPH